MKPSQGRGSGSGGGKAVWVFFLAVILLPLLPGCASSDDQNLSERPWNSPKGWESGLPSGMMDERR